MLFWVYVWVEFGLQAALPKAVPKPGCGVADSPGSVSSGPTSQNQAFRPGSFPGSVLEGEVLWLALRPGKKEGRGA